MQIIHKGCKGKVWCLGQVWPLENISIPCVNVCMAGLSHEQARFSCQLKLFQELVLVCMPPRMPRGVQAKVIMLHLQEARCDDAQLSGVIECSGKMRNAELCIVNQLGLNSCPRLLLLLKHQTCRRGKWQAQRLFCSLGQHSIEAIHLLLAEVCEGEAISQVQFQAGLNPCQLLSR